MIDFRGRREIETRQMLEETLEWTAPVREQLGIDVDLPEMNGAQRMRAEFEAGRPIEEIYRAVVAETAATFAG